MNRRLFALPFMPVTCTVLAPLAHTGVQVSCRQRAAPDALPLSFWLCLSSRARLAWVRRWDRKGPEKREGKIKGPARCPPQSQSARGVATARRPSACVLSRNANPHPFKGCRVLSSTWRDVMRWSWCHGLA